MKVLVFVLGIAILSCQSPQIQKTAPPPVTINSNKESNLTVQEAEERAAGLANITYSVNLQLDDKSDRFAGTTKIDFFLQQAKPLFVDFKYGSVESVLVNDKNIKTSFDGFRIYLPQESLKAGKNSVQIGYTQTYTKNGAGLYKFVDPEDKNIYLYTQFEAMDAHQMFPCFDQPDLKATYKLEVLAPPSWTVISSTRESSVSLVGTQKKWVFDETASFSTYVFSLHAGPYQMWESKAGEIPLRLFARKSLAKQVVPSEWMEPLKYGLKFYGEYFDYPYPFRKYDQVIVPDFNAGAMENVAAVTFSERFVRQGKKTKKETDDLASVILHELAHMWFGDLVTMKWWNGLWLNESFATYISTYAMSKSKNYPNADLYFGVYKAVPYAEDEAVTTHPIETPVPDVLTTFTTFDGITYGKGASVLKALNYYVGDEKFRNGLRTYFKAHQYGNTSIDDFLGAITAESGIPLKEWGTHWLREKGLDSVRVEATCENSRYKSFELVQTPAPGSNVYRPHRSVVGLFDDRNGKMVMRKQVSVAYQAARTSVSELVGQDCAAFVYPNVKDHDYVKVQLDPTSLKTVGTSLSQIDDELVRVMVWINLFQMLRDQKLTLADYSRIAIENLKVEQSMEVVEKILESVLGRRNSYQAVRYYWPKSNDQQRKTRELWISNLEKVLWSRMLNAPAGSDRQMVWFDAYVKATETPAGTARLASLLAGKQKMKGFVPDQDRRWDMVVKVALLGHKDTDAIIASEEKRDTSDKGVKQALAARAATPKQEQKVKMFNDAISNKELSIAKIKSVFSNLNPHTEVEFKKFLNSEFYARLPSIAKEHDETFLSVFVSNLIPRGCDREGTSRLESFLEKNASGLSPGVMKPLQVTLQEEERCLKIREYSFGTGGLEKK